MNQECKTACNYNLKINPKEFVDKRVRFYIESLTAVGIFQHPADNTVKYFMQGVPLTSYRHNLIVLHNHFKFIVYVNGLYEKKQQNDGESS